MAEVVERNIEDCLDEIAHIRLTKLFNEEEIREIVRRRRQHEYSIQKRNKRITDFESYIATELGILRLVEIRRQKNMDFRFKNVIEKSILSRLVRLHKQVCYRFQAHIDLWIRFIFFNRKLGRHLSVARLWERILQVHGRTDPRLWASAAHFHLNEGARAQARVALSKLQTERQALKMAMKKVRRLRKSPTCPQEFIALGLETLHLKKLQESMSHSVHLTWDRAHLRGLREARRLLTQGLAFNDSSAFLLLELLKLEGTAADFFEKRVAARLKKAKEEDVKMEQGLDENNKQQRSKQRDDVRKITEKEDAVAFMNEVVEDVDFVRNGGAFNIVLERLLSLPNATSKDLTDALQIVKKVSSADKTIVKKLVIRQKELRASEATDVKIKQTTNNRNSEPLAEDIAARAEKCYSEFQRLLSIADVNGALAMWNNWYHQSSSSGAGTLHDLLSLVDPSVDPRWMRLLTSRIYALMVAKMVHKTEQTKCTSVEETMHGYREFRHIQDTRVRDTRALMDTLAASNWGAKIPDFWHLYMEFEEKLGDCSRLPSLRWRAEKCLQEGPRTKFLAELGAIGRKKEFL